MFFTKSTRILPAVLTAFLLCVPGISQAEERQENFQKFLLELQAEMQGEGIDPAHFIQAVGEDFSIDEKAIERMHNQPEFKMTFAKYTGSMLSDGRIKKGREMLALHAEDLQRVSGAYGIPPEVLVSLWGIESFYGKWAGRHKIARSLATLAFDSHRKDFFKRELFAAMKILQEGHVAPQDLQGSWAGAMGQCQFMPTSFMAYAADGDADGKKDIWNNESDIFASSANYLKRHDWQTGERWGQRVVLSKVLPPLKLSERGLSSRKPVSEWQKMGVIASSEKTPLPADSSKFARLYIPNGPSEKAFLVYQNFDTILDWNRSSFFAYSVLALADEIAKGREG